MKDTLMVLIGLMTLAMAAGVVFSRNAVYSAFCLILSFFGLSLVYLLWGSTFIATIQILIYTGAIVVLFVFVVMLLNLLRSSSSSTFGWLGTGVLIAAIWSFCALLLRTLNQTPFFQAAPEKMMALDMRTISKLLFSQYLWPFEVLSVFLLALIVAIFALARPEEESAAQGEEV